MSSPTTAQIPADAENDTVPVVTKSGIKFVSKRVAEEFMKVQAAIRDLESSIPEFGGASADYVSNEEINHLLQVDKPSTKSAPNDVETVVFTNQDLDDTEVESYTSIKDAVDEGEAIAAFSAFPDFFSTIKETDSFWRERSKLDLTLWAARDLPKGTNITRETQPLFCALVLLSTTCPDALPAGIRGAALSHDQTEQFSKLLNDIAGNAGADHTKPFQQAWDSLTKGNNIFCAAFGVFTNKLGVNTVVGRHDGQWSMVVEKPVICWESTFRSFFGPSLSKDGAEPRQFCVCDDNLPSYLTVVFSEHSLLYGPLFPDGRIPIMVRTEDGHRSCAILEWVAGIYSKMEEGELQYEVALKGFGKLGLVAVNTGFIRCSTREYAEKDGKEAGLRPILVIFRRVAGMQT
ncbi:hypothetical protein HDK64DRAFT_302999 [Phyllosticta capitalensis]